VEGPRIKEVILTAINTEAYGFDTGESFIDLISNILDKTSVPRISFGSIHPWSINHEFLTFYKKTLPKKRLVNFFHIPLQSGSNKILSLMKRGYTREEFLEKLNILQKINPLAFIGTDIITGFLEESDHDFTDTYNFLSNSPISKFHIFRFSPREKTAACFMAKRLTEPSPTIKIRRAKILSDLNRKKYEQFLAKHLNLSFSAIFLDRRVEDYQEVLLNNQIPALIKTSKNLAGKIKQIKVEMLRMGKLFGRTLQLHT
jgi:threonylcarbamoyladenosine tRNA methylthiotransferase MtaB